MENSLPSLTDFFSTCVRALHRRSNRRRKDGGLVGEEVEQVAVSSFSVEWSFPPLIGKPMRKRRGLRLPALSWRKTR